MPVSIRFTLDSGKLLQISEGSSVLWEVLMSATDDKFYHPRISKRVDFAPDLWMIRVSPGGEFQFAPGQYATLGVEGPQKRSERPYSIVSSPYENEMEFFFELVPDGDLTPQLYKLQRGDQLLMRKVAKGRFTLDTRSGRTHHLLVCTVTGIFDESPFHSEYQIRNMLGRLSSTDKTLRLRMRLASNPGSVGAAWHKSMFLRGACPVHNPEKSAEAGKLYWDGCWPSDQYPSTTNTATASRRRSSRGD